VAVGRYAPEPHGTAVADYILNVRYYPEYTWGLFGSGTLMAPRSTFLKIGPFDEKFKRSAEFDMAIRAAFLDVHFIAVNEALITQYKTFTSDKSKRISLYYALLLRKKYGKYLKSQGAYLSSVIRAYQNYYSACNMKILYLICKLVSYITNYKKVIDAIKHILIYRNSLKTQPGVFREFFGKNC
jgi:GT2 family glycosyltransferase